MSTNVSFDFTNPNSSLNDLERILRQIGQGSTVDVGPNAEEFARNTARIAAETPRLPTAFARWSHVLSNLFAASGQNTDEYLRYALDRGHMTSAMFLASPRNTIELPRRRWFDSHPSAAWTWFTSYARLAESGACLRADVQERMWGHFGFTHEHLQTDEAATYYAAGFAAADSGLAYKRSINEWIQKTEWSRRTADPPPQPEAPTIGIVSGAWQRNNVIRRNYLAYAQSLRPAYRVDLIHLGAREVDECVMGDFDRVIRLRDPAAALYWQPEYQYSALIFTDVGTTVESIVLANQRRAPVQAALLGAQSSWGSLVDYQVTGADVEAPHGQKYYAEKLVRLPGMGVVFEHPPGPRPGFAPLPSTPLVNCPWHPQKMNPGLVATMRAIKQARPDVHFRIFPAGGLLQAAAYPAFVYELTAEIGSSFSIRQALSPQEYLQELAQGSVTLDSFPYGGCNVVVDSLYVGVPVVALQGATWPGRIGAWVVERAGLPEWVGATPEDYAEKACALLSDPKALMAARIHLQQERALDKVFDRTPAEAFGQWIAAMTREGRERAAAKPPI